MQVELIDPEDVFLISMESMIVIGLIGAIVFAYLVLSRYPKVTSQGWKLILIGLVFMLFHAIFDVLDTMQWDDIVVDTLNVLDGATFVIGLLLF
ncbi:MAG: hypothetical protein ACTSQZ_06755, partial [Candidatus Thorarchaeota archaeon]